MSSIVVSGDTSGAVTLDAPTVAGTVTVTLPAASGTMVVTGSSPSLANVTATGNLSVSGNTTLGDASTDTVLMTGAPSIGGAGYGMGMGFRNRIINGAMVIDQRNAGALVSGVLAGSYVLDRWKFWVNGGSGSAAYTVQQSTISPAGFTNSVIITQTASHSPITTQYNAIAQYIEGYNVADFGWGEAGATAVTLSFWVRSSLTGTFGGAVSNSSQARSYPFTYTISSANTWEYKTITVPGDTTGTWIKNNGAGILLFWQLGVGSTYLGTATGAWQAATYLGATGATQITATNGATFYITGVQLEKGSTATAFDYRSYGTELALCQRYYWIEPASSYHVACLDGNLGEYVDAWVTHPVEMRTTPSGVFESINNFYYNNGSAGTNFFPAGGTTSYAGTAISGYMIKNIISNPPGAAQCQKLGQWNVKLSFSAEL
jgi:hypothetical protein